MKQFEYKRVKIDSKKLNSDENYFEELLNGFGGQGWELIYYSNNDINIILKREK